MTPLTITLELIHNNRVTSGLLAIEDHFATDFGFAIVPGHGRHDNVQVTLQDLDFGRFDSEGEAYLIELLNILPGDFISYYVED